MKKNLCLCIIFIFILTCICFILYIKHDQNVISDEIIIGNSAFNHANGGLFCKLGDGIAYSDLNEHGTIYFAEEDGTDRTLLIEAGAYNLYSIDSNLYFQKMSDNSIWKYDMMERKAYCIVTNGVKDLIVTDKGFFYVGDDIYWVEFVTDEKKDIVNAENIQYIDYSNSCIYYAVVNDNGLLNLYQTANMKSDTMIFADIRGSVILDDVLYYINKENELIKYNVLSQLSETIGVGYNVQLWGESIFYIDQGKIYRCRPNEVKQELSTLYNIVYREYEIHSYYICQDYMYLIFYNEAQKNYEYRCINLQNGAVFEL